MDHPVEHKDPKERWAPAPLPPKEDFIQALLLAWKQDGDPSPSVTRQHRKLLYQHYAELAAHFRANEERQPDDMVLLRLMNCRRWPLWKDEWNQKLWDRYAGWDAEEAWHRLADEHRRYWGAISRAWADSAWVEGGARPCLQCAAAGSARCSLRLVGGGGAVRCARCVRVGCAFCIRQRQHNVLAAFGRRGEKAMLRRAGADGRAYWERFVWCADETVSRERVLAAAAELVHPPDKTLFGGVVVAPREARRLALPMWNQRDRREVRDNDRLLTGEWREYFELARRDRLARRREKDRAAAEEKAEQDRAAAQRKAEREEAAAQRRANIVKSWSRPALKLPPPETPRPERKVSLRMWDNMEEVREGRWNKRFFLEVMSTDLFSTIKQRLCREKGWRPGGFRLIYDQRELDDGATVDEYEFKKLRHIFVVPIGGPKVDL